MRRIRVSAAATLVGGLGLAGVLLFSNSTGDITYSCDRAPLATVLHPEDETPLSDDFGSGAVCNRDARESVAGGLLALVAAPGLAVALQRRKPRPPTAAQLERQAFRRGVRP